MAVPTLNIPVNPEGKYPEERIVSFVEIAPEYQMVGGINAPKKIKCLGSDGKWRPQLVKGNPIEPNKLNGLFISIYFFRKG